MTGGDTTAVFRQRHLAFRVLEVLRIDQKKHGCYHNSGRHFCALSFREETDALLTSGYYTVGEVARLVGFQDEKYFSAAFHRAMGCPPSRYLYEYRG